jgi:hypothetical protein
MRFFKTTSALKEVRFSCQLSIVSVLFFKHSTAFVNIELALVPERPLRLHGHYAAKFGWIFRPHSGYKLNKR